MIICIFNNKINNRYFFNNSPYTFFIKDIHSCFNYYTNIESVNGITNMKNQIELQAFQ